MNNSVYSDPSDRLEYHTMYSLTIIRGLPGSGKTLYAHTLSKKTGALLIEPDMLRVRKGKFVLDACMAEEAQNTAAEIHRIVLRTGGDSIYADVIPTLENVLAVAHRCCPEYGPYRSIKMPVVIDMHVSTVRESYHRNQHGISMEEIEYLAAVWEPFGNLSKISNKPPFIDISGYKTSNDGTISFSTARLLMWQIANDCMAGLSFDRDKDHVESAYCYGGLYGDGEIFVGSFDNPLRMLFAFLHEIGHLSLAGTAERRSFNKYQEEEWCWRFAEQMMDDLKLEITRNLIEWGKEQIDTYDERHQKAMAFMPESMSC